MLVEGRERFEEEALMEKTTTPVNAEESASGFNNIYLFNLIFFLIVLFSFLFSFAFVFFFEKDIEVEKEYAMWIIRYLKI